MESSPPPILKPQNSNHAEDTAECGFAVSPTGSGAKAASSSQPPFASPTEDDRGARSLSPNQFIEVVEAYARRTLDEDLQMLQHQLCHGSESCTPLCELLDTSLSHGIKSDSVESRRATHGSNKVPRSRATPFWRLLWNASADFILRILMLAGLVSLALALAFGEDKKVEWVEGASIFMAVLIVVFVTAGNDYVKEKQFAKLFAQERHFVSIKRDDRLGEYDVEEIVVGDVIFVESGAELPADCIVLASSDLVMDESSMSGETAPCRKAPLEECLAERRSKAREIEEAQRRKDEATLHHALRSPVCLSGANVSSGSASMLVVAVGPNSQAGRLFAKLTVTPQPTPLQNKLNALAADIGNAGLCAAIATLVVLLITYWVGFHHLKETNPADTNFKGVLQSHIRFLVEAITIVVVAVPEGLPLAVTLSLAFSVGRMLKENNYVRRLAACETMGGANEICSDKTGTLTQNRMAVAVFWNGSRIKIVEEGAVPLANPSSALGSTSFGDNRSLENVRSTADAGAAVGNTGGEDDPDRQTGRTVSATLNRMRSGGPPPLVQPFDQPGPMELLADAIAVNSTAYLDTSEQHSVETAAASGGGLIHRRSSRAHHTPKAKFVGSPTECALLEFLQKANVDYVKVRMRKGRPQDIVRRFDFSSERKMMSTMVRLSQAKPHLCRIYVKGAAEVVLRLCRSRIDSSGVEKPLEKGQVDRLEQQVVESFTSRALRSICIAYRDVNLEEEPNWNVLAPVDPALLRTNQRASGGAGFQRRRSSLTVPGRSATSEDEDSGRGMHPLEGREFYGAESKLVCLGIAGLRDPVRPEVPAAVARCQDAGINIRMVTGDNLETAKQIALNCNIYHPEKGGIAMTGTEFLKRIGGVVCKKCRTAVCDCPTTAEGIAGGSRPAKTGSKTRCGGLCRRKPNKASPSNEVQSWPPAAPEEVVVHNTVREDVVANMDVFTDLAGKLEVLARSQPSDKFALVLGLKALGSVVAVTGDGTNDAPALRLADVGFAMGITGKETAKQAADIVLLDDNFDSIVRAVLWGRNIYDSIRKFLQFQLTVNIAAVSTAFVSAVILRQSPLSTVQMLWVNLIMDTLASLALATEKPNETLLDRKPHRRDEYLVNRTMARSIIGQAVYQLTVLMVLVFTAERWLPEQRSSYSDAGAAFPGFSEFSPYGKFVAVGRAYRPFSSEESYRKLWFREIGPSRHYTVVFNAFVFMQVFNMINARKIAGELNVFAGCLRSRLWICLVAGIALCQALLVEFGGSALHCHKEGLTAVQWLICVAFGAGGLILQALLRFVPAELAPQVGRSETDLLAPPRNLALASRGRLSTARLSSRLAADSGTLRDSRAALRSAIALQQQQLRRPP